ncbi:MAG: SDR family oxidoreductase [Acidimicrobiales bacterium]
MDLGLRGKVALVTAASKGLGRASALALADEGAAVAICARGEEALRQTERDLATRTDEVTATVVDITEPAAAARVVEATVERFGRLDIVVANAGGPPPGRALEVDDDALRAALEANFLTSVRLVREAVPHMRERGWGRICLITSFSVKQPIPTLALSNSARTALWAWAKTAASDLFGEGITLNLACPGHHATDRMKQLGTTSDRPFGDPGDFGRVVAFLCSEPAGYVSGAALQVDGAQTTGLL